VIEREWAAVVQRACAGGPPPTPAQARAVFRLRQALLRPFPFDHFQGSPSNVDFTGRPLSLGLSALVGNDVDTDGDGVLDSVWLDLGGGRIQLRDGTLVKPLYAIRCLDLQGRINLNVHGSVIHALGADAADGRLARRRDGQTVDPAKAWPLPVGQSFGAADVRVDAVLGVAPAQAALAGLANTRGQVSGMERSVGAVFGRHGDAVGSANTVPRPGRPGVNDARVTVAGQPLARDLWRGPLLDDDFDFWTVSASPARSVFGGSPPDYWSRFQVASDLRGHPLFLERRTAVTLREMIDNPYEFDPSRVSNPHGSATDVAAATAWVDQPFTPAEFEALLRPFDVDNASALPQRMLATTMAAAAGNATTFQFVRNAVTAMSWDTPQVIVGDLDPSAWPASKFDMHDWDLVRGLKMDLNRPFGDGRDSNAMPDGVVDDVSEGNIPGDTNAARNADPFAREFLEAGTRAGWDLTRGLLPEDFAAGQPGPNSATLRSRQLFAQHIFSLLQWLAETYSFIYPRPPESGQEPTEMTDPGSRLFAVDADDADSTAQERSVPPKARDEALRQAGGGDARKSVEAQKDITERVLAQWAVNIVDFLDADAIMTPFRYREIQPKDPPELHPVTRHVVWGCEAPDLLITESLAFHDRGTADVGGGVDPNYDQIRLPQGSLFVELAAVRNPNVPNPPAELYSFRPGGGGAGGEWLLDMGRLAPPNALGWQAPVWRLSIARRPQSNTGVNALGNDPFRILAKYPDTEWLMPHGGSAIGGDTVVVKPGDDAEVAVRPERYVWLAKTPPPQKAAATIDGDDGHPHVDNTFWIRDANAPAVLVRRGGHLVVGPRRSTPLGSVFTEEDDDDDKETPPVLKWGVPSPQRITLNTVGPSAGDPAISISALSGRSNPDVTFARNTLPPPGGRDETVAAIVAAEPPAGWRRAGVGTQGIGLNVSEPLRDAYYPSEPTQLNDKTDVYDLYGEPGSPPDQPFDQRCRGGLNVADAADERSVPLAPSQGTVSNFATIILERLADPLRPHDPRPAVGSPPAPNPDWNPYIPVDFQPVDLTVFTGESPTPDPTLSPPAVACAFYTRQRGFNADLQRFDNPATLTGTAKDIDRNKNAWKPLARLDDLDLRKIHKLPTVPSTAPDVLARFKHELNQPRGREGNPQWAEIPYHSLGWVNSSFGRRLSAAVDGVPAEYDGAPDMPFSMITWHDRPFANPYELLLVPRTAPSRLLTNFRPLDLQGVAGAIQSGDGDYATTIVPDDLFGAQTPGAHLFPLTSLTDRPVGGGVYSRNADVFGRIFEFVRVSSPFACATAAIEDWPAADPTAPERLFKPPFNRIPLYREPGGVNLNTIPTASAGNPGRDEINRIGRKIWDAMRGVVPPGDQSPAPSFAPLSTSPDTTNLMTARGVPAQSLQLPFRSMRGTRHDLTKGSAAANPLLPQGLVSDFSTLDGEFAPRNFTLFGDATGKNASLFAPVLHPAADSADSDPSRDPRLHPWFAFQPLVRAASNATVRSETYAIWVTVGLFEVQPSPAYTWYRPVGPPTPIPVGVGQTTDNPFFADGYQIVREYGGETGDITRYRAFFLYDRSIPVGYVPGADENAPRGILLERFIE